MMERIFGSGAVGFDAKQGTLEFSPLSCRSLLDCHSKRFFTPVLEFSGVSLR
jgi:hypothetical protein